MASLLVCKQAGKAYFVQFNRGWAQLKNSNRFSYFSLKIQLCVKLISLQSKMLKADTRTTSLYS